VLQDPQSIKMTLTLQEERAVEAVAALKKRLKKEKESEQAVVEILREIRHTDDINEAVLRATGIGKTVSKLAKRSESDKVVAAANKLLKKLRARVEKDKQKAEQRKKEKSSSGSEKVEVKAKPTPPAARSASLPEDPRRSKVCQLLMASFTDDSEKAAKETVCVAIEEAMFVEFKDAKSKEYSAKFRSLKFNLAKNKQLREDLASAKIDPKDVVKMTAEQLADPEKRKAMEKAKQDLFNQNRSDWLDANRDNVNKTAGIDQVGGLFVCEECKSTKTTHYQKQTRGADEPMTVFAQCTECGHRWRFGDH